MTRHICFCHWPVMGISFFFLSIGCRGASYIHVPSLRTKSWKNPYCVCISFNYPIQFNKPILSIRIYTLDNNLCLFKRIYNIIHIRNNSLSVSMPATIFIVSHIITLQFTLLAVASTYISTRRVVVDEEPVA